MCVGIKHIKCLLETANIFYDMFVISIHYSYYGWLYTIIKTYLIFGYDFKKIK